MNVPHYVYFLEITYSHYPHLEDLTLYKIGYSSDVSKRASILENVEGLNSEVKGKGIFIEDITILSSIPTPCKQSAIALEQSLHSKYKQYKYKGKPVLPNGNSELYTVDVEMMERHSNPSLFKGAYLV